MCWTMETFVERRTFYRVNEACALPLPRGEGWGEAVRTYEKSPGFRRPSPSLRSTSPRRGEVKKSFVLAMRLCIRVVLHALRKPVPSPPDKRREAERRQAHLPWPCSTEHGSGLSGDRSPFGAPPRRSPGRTHPASAQLQFPRFLRPGALGVTRCNLSRVYRAPRRPVVVPAERWPRAARGRFAKPPAGTALAPPSRSHPECALRRASFDSLSCSRNRDECQGALSPW